MENTTSLGSVVAMALFGFILSYGTMEQTHRKPHKVEVTYNEQYVPLPKHKPQSPEDIPSLVSTQEELEMRAMLERSIRMLSPLPQKHR